MFLELNPLPSLTLATGHDELYAAAAAADNGLTPRHVVRRILDDAAAQPRAA